MMKLSSLPLVTMLLAVGVSYAEVIPQPSSFDKRFQTVGCTPDVIKVKAKVGRLMEIEFPPSETDINPGMGDRDAWTVTTIGNVMYLKPKAAFADTNLRVITNKRKYWFDLVMTKKTDEEPAYRITVKCPEEPVSAVVSVDPVVLAARRAELEKKAIDDRLGISQPRSSSKTVPMPDDIEVRYESDEAIMPPRPLNGDYGVIGPEELAPTSMFDNGEITVIAFAPNNPMPEIFAKEADGSESRVSFHIEDDMMIVHRVAKRLVLRRGSQVACLINGSYNSRGGNSKTHTVSDEVRREIKVN